MRARINGGLIGAYQTPSNTLTSTNRSAGEVAQLTSGGSWPGSTISNPNLPPTITSVVITDSNYVALDDTAVNTAGGYMRILGTNFAQNPQLYFNGSLIANSWVSSTEVRVQLPSNSAGTGITFMLFNATNGSGTIFTTGKTYSGLPSTTNSSPIALTSTTISVQFVGSGDSPFVFSSTNVPSGTSLSSSGLLTGTLAEGTYSFSVTVDDAQLQTTTQSYSLTVSLADPYFYLTSLALTANTTVTGNTFVADFSLNNQDITVAGDTRASPYNPYQTGYYSNYFDGTGDYLSVPYSSQWSLTGDFTVELWVYWASSSHGAYAGIISCCSSSTITGWQILFDNTNNYFSVQAGGGTLITGSAITLVPNTWYHVAFVRSGSACALYYNGALAGSATSSATFDSASFPLYIGIERTAAIAFLGYISNVRVVKGTALYTAAFTPSTTPLTAVSGTGLLTCQSPRLIDNSPNNFAITKNGDTTVVPANPFTTRYDYSVSYYSTNFDGTGDYLTVASASGPGDFPGDFTIEFWAVKTANSSTTYDAVISAQTGTTLKWILELSTTRGFIFIAVTTGNPTVANSSVTINDGLWHHWAISRSGSTTYLFKDGVALSKTTDTLGTTSITGGTTLSVGAEFDGASTFYFNGTISNLRVVKGIAVYTGNFTPSTTPLTSTQSSGTNIAAITQASYSVYFDGTGDYLTVPTNAFLPATNTYTIEMWIYPTAAPGSTNSASLFQITNANTSNFGGLFVEFYGTGTIRFIVRPATGGTNVLLTGASVTLNTWTHVAVSVNAGAVTIYQNGVSASTGTVVAMDGTQTYCSIGYLTNGYTIGQSYFTGYISNLRVVKGQALYTTTFTPSTTPLTTTSQSATASNVSLLTCQSTTIIDNSTNSFTLTVNGDTKVGGSNPFSGSTMLLTSQNSTLIDNSPNAFTITSSGDARPWPVNPFSTPSFSSLSTTIATLGSAYFDGTGDYLSIPYNASLLPSGDFTIECWVYLPALPGSYYRILSSGTNNGSTNWGFSVTSTGTITFYTQVNTTLLTSTTTIAAKQWNHVAVSRSGTAVKIFTNGMSNSFTNSGSLNNGVAAAFAIGSDTAGTDGNFAGYISNVRIVNGTALYTANFFPVLTPLTAVTNTQLLTLQYNGASNTSQFRDASNFQNLITRAGNANQGTASPYRTPGHWSVYLNGTKGNTLSDQISVAYDARLSLGANNFCMEVWYYPLTLPGNVIFRRAGDSTNVGEFGLNLDSSGNFSWTYSITGVLPAASGTQTVGATANRWYHIAAYRIGGSLYLAVNGTVYLLNSALGSSALNSTSTYPWWLGSSPGYSSANYDYSNGYYSNWRIVIGSSVYTASNFTPSTTPLRWIANTRLLACQDPTLVDNGGFNFAITRANGPTVIPVGPFTIGTYTPTSYGVYFDGNADYLTVPSAAANMLGTTYTIECWHYRTGTASSGSYTSVMQLACTNAYGSTVTGFMLTYDGSSAFNFRDSSSTIVLTYASTNLATNTWYHVAVVRNGSGSNNMTMYINGVSVATGTSSGTQATQTAIYIGGDGSSNSSFPGHISNFRITKQALYTTTFTPSTTPLTTTSQSATASNVSLLTCQNTTLIDNSTNAATLTAAGNATLTKFNPFGHTDTTSAATWSPTVNGGSVYFDGNGDSLSVANSAAIDAFGTSPLTMECWVYITSLKGYQAILCKVGSADQYGIIIALETNNTLSAYVGNGAWSVAMTGAVTPTINQWHHIALTRDSSNVWRLFYDGSVANSTTNSISVNSYAYPVYIGKYPYFPSYAATMDLSGYISNVRIVKGTAAYTGPFIPPTAPVTNTTNTSLLLDFNPSVTDWTMNNNLESVGDAKLTVQTPYAGSYYSNYFDGTGDYLSLSSNAAFQFGTGDFTVEGWIYTTTSNQQNIVFLSGTSTYGLRFEINGAGSRYLQVLTSSDGASHAINYTANSGAVSLNTWTHVALVRSGTSIYMFQNGTQVGATQTWSGSLYAGSVNQIGTCATTNYFTGYISNVRITKGQALYTTTFTPSTTPLTTTSQSATASNVSLLTCQSRTFIDNSTNAFAITRNGDVAVRVQNPFTRIADYAVYFDGTGDYLISQPPGAGDFGTGDFTVEFWMYAIAAGTYVTAVGTQTVSGNTTAGMWRVSNRLNSVNGIYFNYTTGSAFVDVTFTTTSYNDSAWHHIVILRSSSTLKAFVDGTQVGSNQTVTQNLSSGKGIIVAYNPQDTQYFTGYITELRITKGYARYTTTFTPNTTSDQFKLR